MPHRDNHTKQISLLAERNRQVWDNLGAALNRRRQALDFEEQLQQAVVQCYDHVMEAAEVSLFDGGATRRVPLEGQRYNIIATLDGQSDGRLVAQRFARRLSLPVWCMPRIAIRPVSCYDLVHWIWQTQVNPNLIVGIRVSPAQNYCIAFLTAWHAWRSVRNPIGTIRDPNVALLCRTLSSVMDSVLDQRQSVMWIDPGPSATAEASARATTTNQSYLFYMPYCHLMVPVHPERWEHSHLGRLMIREWNNDHGFPMEAYRYMQTLAAYTGLRPRFQQAAIRNEYTRLVVYVPPPSETPTTPESEQQPSSQQQQQQQPESEQQQRPPQQQHEPSPPPTQLEPSEQQQQQLSESEPQQQESQPQQQPSELSDQQPEPHQPNETGQSQAEQQVRTSTADPEFPWPPMRTVRVTYVTTTDDDAATNTATNNEPRAVNRTGPTTNATTTKRVVFDHRKWRPAKSSLRLTDGTVIGPKITPYDTVTCSFCLYDMNGDRRVLTLSCRHRFHYSCIVPWRHTGKCPLCRVEFYNTNLQKYPNSCFSSIRTFNTPPQVDSPLGLVSD
jgi:Ring finger domain